ncbi:MAG: hypothetical protein R3F34_10630, partial [Planctomycetota bacterium]
MRSQLTLAALLAAAPTALAQQSWTPLVESGATGRAVQGSPLQPRLLTVGFPFLGALEATYAGGSFEADPNSPHQDLGYLQAVTYDPQGLRAVAYLGEFTGVLGEAGESSIAVHDGTDWTIVPTPSLSARQIPVFVADPIGGGLVLFGGMFPRFPSGIALGDTWRLVGTTWTQLAPAHSPPARLGSAGAVDPVGGTALIFGGRSQQTGGSY